MLSPLGFSLPTHASDPVPPDRLGWPAGQQVTPPSGSSSGLRFHLTAFSYNVPSVESEPGSPWSHDHSLCWVPTGFLVRVVSSPAAPPSARHPVRLAHTLSCLAGDGSLRASQCDGGRSRRSRCGGGGVCFLSSYLRCGGFDPFHSQPCPGESVQSLFHSRKTRSSQLVTIVIFPRSVHCPSGSAASVPVMSALRSTLARTL